MEPTTTSPRTPPPPEGPPPRRRSKSGSKKKTVDTSSEYHAVDLPFARESPYFGFHVEKHRGQLRVADDHLAKVVSSATDLIAAMQAVGSASRQLAVVLEKTPQMFQSKTVTALGGVLQELSSAEDVLAESLELSFAKPLAAFRTELAKVDELRRASARADADAAVTVETLLHGDWAKVEKDLGKQKKLAKRKSPVAVEDDPPPQPNLGTFSTSSEDLAGGSIQGQSLASVVDARAKCAAEKRRRAELKRFDLSRFVSSLQRRKGLVLAEVSVAGLCSLRAFYAQASHAIGDVANAAHREQTSIARACEREREPWDLRMLRLQRILNQRELDLQLTTTTTTNGGDPSDESLPSSSSSSETTTTTTTEEADIRDLLTKAEAAHKVYSFEDDLADLYDESYCQPEKQDNNGGAMIALEGYLYSQTVASGGSRRQQSHWQRRWFTLDENALVVKKNAPGWPGQLLRGVLAREASTPDDEEPPIPKWDLEDELVATLLLSSVKVCGGDREDRCAFEVHSAHGQAYRLQCHGDDECKKWVQAMRDGVERQLVSGKDTQVVQRAVSSSAVSETAAEAPVVPGQMLRAFSSDPDSGGQSSPSTPAPRRKKKDGLQSPTTTTPKTSSSSADDAAARVLDQDECAWRLAKIEAENPRCSDCGAEKPDWCVINHGVLICLRCSGVHRSLGTHVSKVRSLRLDRISPLELSVITNIGNDAANSIYEDPSLVAAAAESYLKPTPDSDAPSLAAFIRAKWRDKLFVKKQPTTDLRGATLVKDVVGMLGALAAGGDMEARGSDGLAPLHIAAKHKNFEASQMLVINGAKIDAHDAFGFTPLDHFLKFDKINDDLTDDVRARYHAHLRRLLTPSI